MQTLTTLMSTLFQPNENLISIFYFPLSFIEAFISSVLFTNLFNINSTKKIKAIYIFSSALLTSFSRLIIPMPYETIFNIFVMFILIKVIFKINTLKSIACLIVPFIFVVIIETIISVLSYYCIHISISELTNIPIYAISLPLFIYALMFLLHLLLKKLNVQIKILDNFAFGDKAKLVLTGILGLVAIYLNLYIIFYYSNFLPNEITITSIFVLVMYFLVSTYCLIKTNNLEIAKQNIENLQLYNKTLTIMHDNIRAFKHDFNNIVQAIGGYIETEDLDSLKRYYKDLIKDCYSVTNLETLKPEIINNPSIYSILASKYYKADADNIQINLEVDVDLNTLNITTYELTRMLGILLDNSIEAAKECDEKIINVKFYDDESRHRQLVIIENTYANKDVDTIKIFEKDYTTKEHNTGLGLWEVNKILNKHNNLSLFTTKNNKFFIQQLEIYKK